LPSDCSGIAGLRQSIDVSAGSLSWNFEDGSPMVRLLVAGLSPVILLLAPVYAQPSNPAKPIPEGVEQIAELVYVERPTGPLKLDLYRPRQPADKPWPVVVWIHGGGWKQGNKFPCPAAWLATQGYAVASIQYRLSTVARWPAQIEDCRDAVRWLRQHGAKYQLQTERIGVWGGSAGGHLAAMLGTLSPPPKEPVSSRVQAVCDFYGPSDLLTMPANTPGPGKTDADLAQSNGALLLGGTVKDQPDRARSASPLHQVSADDPPFLIVHGDRDPLVPLEQSQRLAAALKQSGVPVELRILPGAGHGGPAFQSDPVRGEIRAFFDRHLKPRQEFTTLIAHWDRYDGEDYLDFVREARPEICQVGFYGGHFYSLAHTPQYRGYPAHFPVRGLAECGRWHEERNQALHRLGAKVVGHFNVTFLVGEPESPDGPQGFFKFYRDLWDEAELGPKPVADPRDLLARNPDGSLMAAKSYGIGGMREYTACLNNPHWRTVLKAWAKRGIERGVDGFMINYFYRHNCVCDHCQRGFREYLRERFTPQELKEQFAIANLENHRFSEIVGWHNPQESTPLRREMLRWSQLSTKAAFDDVFVHYARSLKPDLILGQWNHLGNFQQISGDERTMLPAELWGRDETYLWYSTGGTACYTDLRNGYLGEGTLQARYIRGAFDDKPYTLGKYEQTRIRVTIAELAANGGVPMGFYCRHTDPEARAIFTRYYGFLHDHDRLFRGNRSSAEFLLLYPRSRVHAGDVAAVEAFRRRGTAMLNQHLLFDILPDDQLTPDIRKRYLAIIDSATPENSLEQLSGNRSRFTAPATVRVSASRPAGSDTELTLHFVNYNRTEPEKPRSPGGGIQDEKPIPVTGIRVDLPIPSGQRVAAVRFLTPEQATSTSVPFSTEAGRLLFTVPEFLVYGVVSLELTRAQK
jgi:acetyl esterase/lipase